jgi:membrane protease YdiL (CAAX protease family)
MRSLILRGWSLLQDEKHFLNRRSFIVAEIASAFLLILAQIWFVGRLLSVFTLLPLGVIAASWVRHGESFRTLGLNRFDFEGTAPLWIFFVVGSIIIGTTGFFIDQSVFQKGNFASSLALRFCSYLIPALCQQIIFNGYFVRRIHSVAKSPYVASAISGILFCAVHAPNPVLLILTLFGGIFFSYFFIRNGKIYSLAIAHAALAAFAYCVLPQSWHHGFRVGMQYALYVPIPGNCCIPEFLRTLIP